LAQPIPSTEPSEFAAGETVQWRRSYGEFLPSAGWLLKYYFAGPDIFTVAPAQVNGEWLATIAPATTAAKKAGTYRWTAYAELVDGGGATTERRRVAAGTVLLTVNVTTAIAGDLVPFAEQALPIIEAAIKGRLTVDQQSFQIDGTAVMNIPILELKRLRGQLRAELWRKRNPGKVGQPVQLRFVRPL
jgi:hypothetical protein